MTEMITGWYLPAGVEVTPQPVLIPRNDASAIAAMIGNGCQTIDAVSNGLLVNDTENQQAYVLVGYVDDEGWHHDHDINFLATVLFGHDDFLVGDCYVINGTSSTGEYDGDSYDIPDVVTEAVLPQLLFNTAETYNKLVFMFASAQLAESRGVLDMRELLEEEDEDKQMEIMNFLAQYGIAAANTASSDDELDDAIDRELREMTDGKDNNN
jgi:hypothetical protein